MAGRGYSARRRIGSPGLFLGGICAHGGRRVLKLSLRDLPEFLPLPWSEKLPHQLVVEDGGDIPAAVLLFLLAVKPEEGLVPEPTLAVEPLELVVVGGSWQWRGSECDLVE